MTSRMLKEIYQQPDVLKGLLDEERQTVQSVARELRKGGFRFVILTARGTSDNAALYAKYLFEIELGTPVSLASPSAFTLYGAEMDLREVLVIGISQSGESKDVLEVVRKSRRMGAKTLSVTNAPASPLAEEADFHLWLRAGEEESVAATKTYTAELLLMYLLVNEMGRGAVSDVEVERIPQQAQRTLENSWEKINRYCYVDYTTVISRGYNFATAREAALKLMETTYAVAEAFSEADLRHGPMAMIGEGFPVVLILPPGRTRRSMLSLAENLRARGAELLTISESSEQIEGAVSSFHIPTACSEELSPILYALPIQLLAHDLSVARGLDPDAPRGLSKVTESW